MDDESDAPASDENKRESGSDRRDNGKAGLAMAKGSFDLLSLDEVDDDITESEESDVEESE